MSNNGNAMIAEKRERHILALQGAKIAALAVYMRTNTRNWNLNMSLPIVSFQKPMTT